jgi:sulfur relay (sulfurtransferase) complex TusBCD TusD component (DsrE family)
MKIVILLKSGPCTDEANRALQAAEDMLAQGHTVSLYLLQEAVRFFHPRADCSNAGKLQDLVGKNLVVNALTTDAELRGIELSAAGSAIADGSYEALVNLMTSCDRVVGIL